MTNSEQTPAVLRDIASQLPAEYTLLEYLGEGGHGVVLKAMNKPLQKIVALKIIKTDISDELQKRTTRMQNEARILAKLQHPNIVQVLQMGTCADQTPFLVCEYLEGITLEQFLKTTPQLNPQQIINIFTQMLDALSCAHENELLHRDIKPSNIMLITDPESKNTMVKLLDFGIARDFETMESTPLGLTRTIQISGSAPYMSPEQCRGERIDQRSDIYSVACTLYECLAGQPPFQGETPMHTRYLQIHEEAQLPNADRFAHTRGRSAVYRLCLQALSKDRSQRPQTAAEFRSLLIEALPMSDARKSWSTKKTSRILPVAILAASLSLLTLGLYFQPNNNLVDKPVNSENYREKTKVVLRPHSPMVTLKDLFRNVEKFRFDHERIQMEKGLGYLQTLDEILNTTSAKDKAVRYAAYRMRAELEESLGFLASSKEDWIRTLELCATPDKKKHSIDAVECYARIADIDRRRLSPATAREVARDGLRVAGNPGPPLELPGIIDFRTGRHDFDCYRVLAEIAESEGKQLEAIDLRTKEEEIELLARGTCKSTFTLTKVAEALLLSGQKDKAATVLEQRLQEIRDLPESDMDADTYRAYMDIGLFFQRHDMYRQALKAFRLALACSEKLTDQGNIKYCLGEIADLERKEAAQGARPTR